MDFSKLFTRQTLIVALFAIGAAVISAAITDYRSNIVIQALEARVEKTEAAYNDVWSEANAATAKVQALESKLADLKSQEDLMKRDLQLYITKKYRRIPKVLATSISENTVRLVKKYNAPFPIVVGIMEVESRFNPMAVSKAGARGLMQVMPFWVKKMDFVKEKYDFHNVSTGIEAGIVAFNQHLKEADNNIAKGLYYYVGKDHTYKNKVFSAMGEFVAFRATVDDENVDAVHTEINGNSVPERH